MAGLALGLVAGGDGNATIRLGWEMTGDWFAWNGVKDPAAFAGAFRQAVTAMRGVPGQHFTFDFNVAMNMYDPAPMYPGDAYVDIIGADNYDTSWATDYTPTDHAKVWNNILTRHVRAQLAGDLRQPARQADEHPRVGRQPTSATATVAATTRTSSTQIHNWVASHDVAYEAYFESTDPSVKATFALENGQFSQAAARYRALFGAGSASATSASPPPVQPSS